MSKGVKRPRLDRIYLWEFGFVNKYYFKKLFAKFNIGLSEVLDYMSKNNSDQDEGSYVLIRCDKEYKLNKEQNEEFDKICNAIQNEINMMCFC